MSREARLFEAACANLQGLTRIDEEPVPGKPGFFAARRLRKAIRLLDEVLSLNPHHAPAAFFKGKALERLDDLPRALDSMTLAVALAPDMPAAAREAAGLAARLRRFDVSMAIARTGLEHRPDDAGLWSNLGLSLLLSRQPADATVAFARAAKLEPSHPVTARLLELSQEVSAGRRACPRDEDDILRSMQGR